MSRRRWSARRVRREAVGLLLRVVPSSRRVLVDMGQDDEDNALVVAARLADGAAGPVVLSCADPNVVRPRLRGVADALGLDVSAVRVVVRSSRAGVLAFVRSRLVLYTHGMLGSPVVGGRRVHVNLWHGSGPKWLDHGHFEQFMGASHVVASSRAWGRETARALAMTPDVTLLHGNPRQDLLRAAPDRSVLAAWGLDPDRPVVVWMPTFRTTAVMGATEGQSVAGSLATDPLLRDLVERGTRRGVQFVVKTHPYDTDAWDTLPIRRLTSEDLWSAGLSIYRFLALADGLISDYSSVWVDYLVLDRPIALYCPDLAAYAADRGLNEPSMAVAAAELLITDSTTAAAFVDAVADGDASAAARTSATVRDRLDYVPVHPTPSLVLREELLALGGGSAAGARVDDGSTART